MNAPQEKNGASKAGRHRPGSCLCSGVHAQTQKDLERTHEHHDLVVLIVHFAPEVGDGEVLPRQEVDVDEVPSPYGQHSYVTNRSPFGPLLK